MKRVVVTGLMMMALALLPGIALAADLEPSAAGVKQWTVLGAGLAIGLGAIGGGVGMGTAISGALEGISRNPETGGRILTIMLIGLAMIESLTIYALVISLILLFANPYV